MTQSDNPMASDHKIRPMPTQEEIQAAARAQVEESQENLMKAGEELAESAGAHSCGCGHGGCGSSTSELNEPINAADVEEALRDVIDPELGINVVDLGLLYGVVIEPDGAIVLDMTLTSAACPLTDVIEEQAAQALSAMSHDVRIQWVWLPPWGPDKITPEGREQLRALGFNV
ncbi:metal-sulfur cluster assembly factor [Actinomyces vulturis]|nr:metal-sulfur cluster assembly factor [Actinomyces vulturis]